jgi:hypothetical protein
MESGETASNLWTKVRIDRARSTQLGADAKDWLENRIHTRVCRDRDDSELHRYQAAFAQDWIALQRRR